MNLKTAARVLGVHYQTAYRWVRSGELVAVKVGAGYEISEAALARFRAQRAALGRAAEHAPPPAPAPARTAGEALDVLDEMVDATLIDASPVEARATQLVATTCGDAVALHRRVGNGTLRLEAFDHGEPRRAALMRAMFTHDHRGHPAYARAAVHNRAPVLVTQVPQSEVRGSVPAEFHQYLSQCGVYSAMSAPIMCGGEVCSALSAIRDAPGRPYTGDDLEFLVAVADRVGCAVERAEQARAAWELRAELVGDLSRVFAENPHASSAQWLADRVGEDEAVVIVELDQHVCAATKCLADMLGVPREELVGRALADFVAPAREVASTFERLRDGELDYCTVVTRPVFDAGRAVVLDGALVSRPDATPCCVLYVAHAPPGTAQP